MEKTKLTKEEEVTLAKLLMPNLIQLKTIPANEELALKIAKDSNSQNQEKELKEERGWLTKAIVNKFRNRSLEKKKREIEEKKLDIELAKLDKELSEAKK